MAQCLRFDLVLICHIDPISAGHARLIHSRLLFPKSAVYHCRPIRPEDEVYGSLMAACACFLRGFGYFVVASHPLP